MLTLGVDLATDPKDTATCLLDWNSGRCAVARGADDAALLDAMARADRVGIDAPFGWPDAFREAIEAWAERGAWIAGTNREPLRLRETDRLAVQTGARPMSVSTNLLGATAMRCAHLLAEHHRRAGTALDRVHGAVVEVYPAGSLAAWGVVEARRYKEAAAAPLRRRIAERLEREAGLAFGEGALLACERSDHNLDALVCSLTARAVDRGLVRPVEVTDTIAREGWIHLPRSGSLGRLRAGS